MGANKKLDHALATSMAIVMSGMEWTQGKKAQCNLVESDSCLVCGESDTSFHRRTSCLGVLELEGPSSSSGSEIQPRGMQRDHMLSTGRSGYIQ